MIQSFSDKDTETLFHEEKGKRFHQIARATLRKLIQMNRAGKLDDLRVPPGNCLEALQGNMFGYYSIRINQQWRIVFKWTDHGPTEMRITDYH